MKYALILSIFFLLSFTSTGTAYKPTILLRDTVPTGVAPQLFGAKLYEFKNYALIDSFLMVVSGDTFAIPRWPALKYKGSDNRWYGYHGDRWRAFLTGLDTISLSNRIDAAQTEPALPFNSIQFNNGGVFGGDAGLTVNATTNTITADSLQLNNHLSFAGDIGPTTTEAIRFGRPGDYFHTFDDAGSSGGKLWMVYPKFACDTCRNNQPFYATVSTSEYDVAQSPNSVFDYLAIGDGSFERPLLRLAVEQDFYDTWEIHFPETKPRNSNARDRPMSMAINKTTRRATNIYRFEDQTHTNSLGTYQYFRLTPPTVSITPYYSAFQGQGRITLSVNDSTTNAEMGGFMLDVQNSAGVDKSLYQHFGEQITHNTPAGFYNLSSAVGAESNVNYGYYVTSGNTGRIMDIGKIGASTIAMQVHNNGRITLNRADQADDGNIFQVYATGSQAAITARVDNTGTNDVSYPLDIMRFSSGTITSGFGMGIRFRSQNTSGGFPYIGNITTVFTDVTGSSEDADYVFNLIRAGSITEGFRIKSTGAAVFNNAFTFPVADGTNGQVLQTNGSGTVSWQTPVSGISGSGTSGRVAFWNGASSLTSAANFLWDGNTLTAQSSGASAGVIGISNSGFGVVGESTSGEALSAQIFPSSTNTLVTVGRMQRFTSGTAANGIGGAIDWFTQSSGGSAQRSNRIGSVWSDATTATRTSIMEFYGLNNATEARKAALAGNGQWTWDGYGGGTHSVTPATTPVISSSGVVGERIAPKVYTALISATAGNDPTATVLGTNEIGTIVWTRNSAGNYTGTLSSAFTANKTWMVINQGPDGATGFVRGWLFYGTTNTVTLRTQDNVGADVDAFVNIPIRIEVYP